MRRQKFVYKDGEIFEMYDPDYGVPQAFDISNYGFNRHNYRFNEESEFDAAIVPDTENVMDTEQYFLQKELRQ